MVNLSIFITLLTAMYVRQQYERTEVLRFLGEYGQKNWPQYYITRTLPNLLSLVCGPGSSVGIATDYGLDGPGSNPVGTRYSSRPDRPWGPPSLQ